MSALPQLQHFSTTDPRATVLLLHGYAEYTGRYPKLITLFNDAGFEVFAYDQRNHGACAPKDHAVVDVRQLLDDHLELREQVRARMNTEQLFLFGHSMGGLLSAASALVNPRGLAGVALSGPAFLQYPPVPKWVARLALPLARLAPRFSAASIASKQLAHDPQIARDFIADPLNYQGKVPLLTGTTMALVGHETLADAMNWDQHLPLQIFHGDSDGLANVQGSRDFARASGGNLVEVPGGYHEIFQEPEADELHQQLLDFYLAQL
ncbi:MAG: alpha/beta fold hydrolase [Corynebacterium sp.]|nr:alpha/beta fold hydrolase [Corynebacterium sp.]